MFSPFIKRCSMLALLLAAVTTSSRVLAQTETDAHRIVAASLAVVGGAHDLHSIRSFETSIRTISFHVADSDHADEPYLAQFSDATIFDDLPGSRMVSQTVANKGTAQAETTSVLQTRDLQQTTVEKGGQRESLSGAPARTSWETHNPIRALLLAEKAADLSYERDTTVHGAPQHVLSFHNGPYLVRLYINAYNSLPSAVDATVTLRHEIAWAVWGDEHERTEFQNWSLVDGVRFPFQTDVFRNDARIQTIVVFTASANAKLDDKLFQIDPETRSKIATYPSTVDDFVLNHPVPEDLGPVVNRPITEIAPGIVQIPGSWYTTLVRQSDGVVVIDAPISAGYSKQVIAEIGRRYPGVPIKALICSTPFFWHVAGVREYAAQGVPIYVLDENEKLMRALLAAPHTLAPDDLARSGRDPIVRVVSAKTNIGEGHNALALYPIRRGSNHMIMSYIPDAKLLHAAEMAQPFGPNDSFIFPESLLELRDTVRDQGIDVETLIGMHLGATPWSALEADLKKAGMPK